MYYEVYGDGKPLVLLHGGGSTIQASFGRIIPQLARQRQIIGVELQAHGRTNDRQTDLSFEQDADDTAELMTNLDITKADFLGFSNGGTSALQIAIRHPKLVDKIIICSALAKRSGAPAGFWEFMNQATIDQMPRQYKDAYLKVAPDSKGLQTMHDKCVKRMVEFKDISDEQIKTIKSPTLIVTGDTDVMTPEHAVEIHRLIPGSRLAIIPGGHGQYLGEITTTGAGEGNEACMISIINNFLDRGNSPGQ